MEQTINNKILELRIARNITQRELASIIGVTRQTIIAIEKGNYIPSLLLALRISMFFKKNIEDVFFITYEK